MQKRHTLIALLSGCALLLSLTAGCSEQPADSAAAGSAAAKAAGVAVGVSELKANPDKYLGAISLSGRASKVFAEEGVVEIADGGACCAVYLFVPFTEAQRDKLGADRLYRGTLPALGTDIIADAELSKSERGYLLTVKAIRNGEAVLVAQL